MSADLLAKVEDMLKEAVFNSAKAESERELQGWSNLIEAITEFRELVRKTNL
jgi:hypothetical protein